MKFETLARTMVILAVCILWLGLSPGHAEAAQTVHLTLEIDGQVIEGESTVTSMDRENTIECSSFGQNGYTPIVASTGLPGGVRQHRPISILKRVDKSSPLLWKAWSNGEPVTTAYFRFYRPSPGGSGAEEHFFTVLLEGGIIASVSTTSQDAIVGGETAPPAMESVTFTFESITWTYEIGGAQHMDTWASPR